VERNLSRRKEIVAAEVELEAERLSRRQVHRVIACQVVAFITQRVLERTVGARAFVGYEGVASLQVGAISEKGAKCIERTTLEACRHLVRQRLLEANVDDPET